MTKTELELERKKQLDDIMHKADISRAFMADPRHKEFVAMVDSVIAMKREIYDVLGDTVQSNDEYLRRSLVISTEIKTLKWLLYSPQRFIATQTRILEKEKEKKNA